jgi:hypothetical protein
MPSWNQGRAPRRRNSSVMLSSYSHVKDFVFNVHSYCIIGKIILLYPKEITAAISSTIYPQHQWSRLSSINKASGYKWMDKETTSLTFIGRLITSSTPLGYSLSHNNISQFVSTTPRTPELLTIPFPKQDITLHFIYKPMWQSFLEKLTVLQQIKIFQFHGTRRINTVFTKAHPVPRLTFCNIKISTSRCCNPAQPPYCLVKTVNWSLFPTFATLVCATRVDKAPTSNDYSNALQPFGTLTVLCLKLHTHHKFTADETKILDRNNMFIIAVRKRKESIKLVNWIHHHAAQFFFQ